MTTSAESDDHSVNFAVPRSFATTLKAAAKEALFPDDPFHDFKNQPFSTKTKKAIQYFGPICQWLPTYNLRLFRYDLLAGISIASPSIPQGISYAKIANIPVVIGLCKPFRRQT